VSASPLRLHVEARGAVQGVGLRPFVHRLAADLKLPGWVRNTPYGVEIEVEGIQERLESFLVRLRHEPPPRTVYHGLEHALLEPRGFARFEILPSARDGVAEPTIPTDVATCAECLRELLDPANRRFRYAFTTCAACGPRYTIIDSLPYDRPATAMRAFALCATCRAEYDDPGNRRYHAEAIACADCGPKLALCDSGGRVLAAGDAALRAAVAAVTAGKLVALKGIGGFQLVCDARNGATIERLRQRKRRPTKPFAVMVATLEQAHMLAALSALETQLLASPEAPIVLCTARPGTVADGVAPASPLVGLMLPASPLHQLLARDADRPLVVTSGNLADEPLATDNDAAFARLVDVADLWLVHDRPIERPIDDSVVRVIAGRATLLRRARGYAPAPFAPGRPLESTLALGGHAKSTVAITVGGHVVLGPHIGDLGGALARATHERAAHELPRLCASRPTRIACDPHRDYASSTLARALGPPVIEVQHHVAHVAACLCDNDAAGPVLGVAFDGAGKGPDGTLWGGEFLVVDGGAWRRVAHLRTFPLPGGERAFREPRRAALGLAFEVYGAELPEAVTRLFAAHELTVLLGMLRSGMNCPRTSSVGRLFDAAAALVGLGTRVSFEGEAAMALEFAATAARARHGDEDAYPLPLDGNVLDTAPLLTALLEDLRCGRSTADVALKFHTSLVHAIVAVARDAGQARVALTGGCFQNALLTELAVEALTTAGFGVLRHGRVPPNDGGLALGQAIVAGL
jgi:hydrogenase maturation protein HypF